MRAPRTKEYREKMSQVKKGHPVSEETKRKIGEAQRGEKNHRFGKHHTEEHRKKLSEKTKGSKSVHWKGGSSNPNVRIRMSVEYKLWREAVFRRDKWKCIWCGTGGYLNADHIKPFALFPELRFALDNGRTLCVPCHRTTDTFGNRTKKLKAVPLPT